MSQIDLSDFVQKNKLGTQFTTQALEFFAPLARELANLHQNKQSPILVGINGAQGSGKSTLSALLVEILAQQYDLPAVSLSLDDFYYTKPERQHLAHTLHPLLATRGVPGTHDIMLANDTLDALMHHNDAQVIQIPRFNKAIDDRHDESQWSKITRPPAIIIFEGWCVGAQAQTHEQLIAPINSLEKNEDPNGIWRHYVNQQLTQHYEPLFSRFDCTVMLKAPSFQCVFNWRLEQEQKLITSLESNDTALTMSPKEIQRFIQHYQRITEHVLETLPQRAEYVFELDEKRRIQCRKKLPFYNPLSTPTLFFTDLDGSLLDHHNYSYQDALSTLDYLEQNALPVIPCSSKTQAEIETLRREINNQHPFIIENGAAVYIPKSYFSVQPSDTHDSGDYWVKSFVETHDYWLGILNKIEDEFPNCFQPFSKMSTQDIAQATGLTIEQATLAAKRQYGEPVLWLADEQSKQRFIAAASRSGASVLQGGRFLHICGDANKGKALIWLANTYQQLTSTRHKSVAIGDSHNDIQMLDMADIALIIRSPVHGIPSLSRINDIYISEGFGPTGWTQGVQQILDDLFSHYLSSQTGEHHG